MGLVQPDHEPPLTPAIAAGTRRGLNRSGRPFSGRIRDLQHRVLPASGIIEKDEPRSMIKQRAEDVRTRLRSDQGSVSRVVQMVGAFVVAKALGEEAVIHDDRRARLVRGSAHPSSDPRGRHTTFIVSTSKATRGDRVRLWDLGPLVDPRLRC